MIVPYDKRYDEDWDDFVLNNSINGNFLQTRNFYNYHPEGRFTDASVLLMKNDRIAAVVPGNETDGGKTFIAHEGSTFGGIVIGRDFANTGSYNWIFDELIEYFNERGYSRAELRMHNWLYSPCERRNELCEYYFQLKGFTVRAEIGFYKDLKENLDDYILRYEKLKRRKLNKAMKYGMTFKKLETDEEVSEFHDVLKDNYRKFGTEPIHTGEDFLEFKNHRLKDVTSFYGVIYDDRIIAGSMVWNFCDKKVFHTQYLASLHEYLECCPNEFLYMNLMRASIREGYRYLSYGTASLEHGEVYNESLGMYKEGFDMDSYMNRAYIWERKNGE